MSNVETEPKNLPVEELRRIFGEYESANEPYLMALYIKDIHTYNPGGLDDEAFKDWCNRFPLVDESTFATYQDNYNSRRAQVSKILGISTELIDDLTIAVREDAQKSEDGAESCWPGLVAGPGQEWLALYRGLVTMSRLTGVTYKLHAGDVDTNYYEINPTTPYPEHSEK